MTCTLLRRACALFILAGLAAPTLAGEEPIGNPPAIALQVAGPSWAKIDIVFLGDGYAPWELGKLVADARRAMQGMLQRQPYARRANEFNFIVINVWNPTGRSVFDVEVEDGKVVGLDRDDVKDTAEQFSFFDGLDRTVLLVNGLAARGVAFSKPTGFFAGLRDFFGGFRDIGPAVVPAEGGDLGYVTAHELAHTMGNLLDEYLDSPRSLWTSLGSPKGPRGNPCPNLTGNPYWWDPYHPFAFYFRNYEGVGLFRGNAIEFADGLYRLTNEGCAMRSFGATAFCPVCTDAIEYELLYGRR